MSKRTSGRLGLAFALLRLDPKRGRPAATPTLAQRFFQLFFQFLDPLFQGRQGARLRPQPFALLQNQFHQRRGLGARQFFEFRAPTWPLHHEAIKAPTTYSTSAKFVRLNRYSVLGYSA
ncbi:hypothetical protein BH20VER1_BH20VER1_01180 [soil metagenome]